MSSSAVASPLSVGNRASLTINAPASLAAAAGIIGGAALLGAIVNPQQAALYVLGAALGLVLYHAAFGFTSAWRVFIADRRGEGLRAQMVMLAVASILFFPVLASGSLFGQPVAGNVSPLYTVGGGSTRMVITLAAFVAGSAIGAAHLHWWTALPSLPKISIIELWGPWTALAVQLVVFAIIAGMTVVLEKRRHGQLIQPAPSSRQGLARFTRGPWPLVAGAVALALLNFVTLYLAGRPWGVTSAFALWGSKIAAVIGFDVASWPYWSSPASQAALNGSIFNDITTVMDFGIILGALLAAALAGRFAPTWKVPLRSAIAAVVGGLLLGYGARLAYGCNIGAYFSGIASGSLHGWVWLVAAFAGNVIGTRVRPLFGLEVERVKLTGC
jgi:uncharacterized membrane protein YedE/YeeE